MSVIEKTIEASANTSLPHVEQTEGTSSPSTTDRIFGAHRGGKIRVAGKFPIDSPETLSLVYTPGVGHVCRAIAADPAQAYQVTGKGNSVAVVTDGSAVL
ncbi:MAG: NAD-dependent malic enzyme, partial [Nitrospira sp. SB0678_bin_10]|nr:NAD-dependent malic enzyme [Nitrospira sp. SB0678_bin_10]